MQWTHYVSYFFGGAFLANAVPDVPLVQNRLQGTIIGACFTVEKITPGMPFIVVGNPMTGHAYEDN
jgi:hypothetical protein